MVKRICVPALLAIAFLALATSGAEAGLFGRKSKCCEPACCAPACEPSCCAAQSCCEPSCCAVESCCEPSCCAAQSCCEPAPCCCKRGPGLFERMCGMFKRNRCKSNCCAPACCEPSCCAPSCGCH